MENNTYIVVTRDGCEHPNLRIETIKDWYLRCVLGDDSLVLSSETLKWTMLKQVFNLAEWNKHRLAYIADRYSQKPQTFDDPAKPSSAPSFNHINSSFDPSSSQNQQPPRNQTDYLSNQNAHEYQQSWQRQPFVNLDDSRFGMKTAAVLLCINSLIYVLQIIVMSVFSSTNNNSSEAVGEGVGRSLIPLLIDLTVASYLWNTTDPDKWRKIAMVRAGLGGFIFGIVFPSIMALSVGLKTPVILTFIYVALCCGSFFILLWGKEAVSNKRVAAGIGAFAFSILALVMLAFNFSIPNNKVSAELKSYELPDRVFTDTSTGATIKLPNGWKMLNPKNPNTNQTNTKMVAYHPELGGFAMLQILPVPNGTANFDFDRSVRGVIDEMDKNADKASVNVVSNVPIRMKNWRQARRAVFSWSKGGKKMVTNMLTTINDNNVFVLQEWCGSDAYSGMSDDFNKLEEAFVVP